MKQDDATDVLICGAGAAGLTLAIDLARRGITFRLIDKMAQPFHGSRGKGIQPRTLEVFEDLGMADRMAALGNPYPPQRLHRDDGSHLDTEIVETRAPDPAEPYGAPLLLPQFLTEQIMRERLLELGHRAEFGITLTGLAQDDEGVVARLSGHHGDVSLRARYLVGADGGRSTVRQLLGIAFPGKTLGVRALVADVILRGMSRDAWHRFNEGDMARQIALCPLGGTPFFQVQAPVPLEGEVDLSAAGLDAMVKARTGLPDVEVSAVSWASAYNMNARLADRYRDGRVFLAGDAAHIHPPTGGQGLNTSVQDAYNLGWKLAAVLAGAPAALLDTYENERRPVAAEMLGLSTALLDAAKRGDMRRGREVRQLDLGYNGSSLSLQGPLRQGPMPGDRAPDAPVKGAAGQPLRLFNLFAGPHWTLLTRDADPAVVKQLARPGLHVHRFGIKGDLTDTGGHFMNAYGLEQGEAALVRPDGYLAAVFSCDDVGTVQAVARLMAGAGVASGASGHASVRAARLRQLVFKDLARFD
jgi:2-polyprenyl-6-methoxyphenol hydroxylase-like FAD-dependent oxidoreductase